MENVGEKSDSDIWFVIDKELSVYLFFNNDLILQTILKLVESYIHVAAGEDLLRECEFLEGCETGHAKITGGYKLPAKCKDYKYLLFFHFNLIHFVF